MGDVPRCHPALANALCQLGCKVLVDYVGLFYIPKWFVEVFMQSDPAGDSFLYTVARAVVICWLSCIGNRRPQRRGPKYACWFTTLFISC